MANGQRNNQCGAGIDGLFNSGLVVLAHSWDAPPMDDWTTAMLMQNTAMACRRGVRHVRLATETEMVSPS